MTNNPVAFSVYVSAFNLIKNGFDYQAALSNFLDFVGEDGEVVIAVNTSEDGTADALRALTDQNNHLKVVETHYSYSDITFDGAVKNVALQATTNPIKIQMDMDERFVQSQRRRWALAAEDLLSHPETDCLLIPSVDLFGGMETIRADRTISSKFRMHKSGLRRGVIEAAWAADRKTFDTGVTDSGDLVKQDGTLASYQALGGHLHPGWARALNASLYTLHFGYLDFTQRVRVNQAIWAEHWPLRSGHPENVVVSTNDLDSVPTVRHNLILT